MFFGSDLTALYRWEGRARAQGRNRHLAGRARRAWKP